MKITVITLYRGGMVETYVAAVAGEITEEQEKKIALSLELMSEDGEVLDELGFETVELCENVDQLKDFVNAYPDGRTHNGEWEDDDS